MAAARPPPLPPVAVPDVPPANGLEAFIIREQDITIGSELGRGACGVALNCNLPAVAKVRVRG